MRTAEVLEVLEVRPLLVAEEGLPPTEADGAGPAQVPTDRRPAPVTA